MQTDLTEPTVRAPGALRLALELRAPLGAGRQPRRAADPDASAPRGRRPSGAGVSGPCWPPTSRPGPLRRYLQGPQLCRRTAGSWAATSVRGPGVLDALRAAWSTTLHERYGRKVSLIGWSLGGIYARETAKRLPTRCAASSRWARRSPAHPRATNAWQLYEFVSGEQVDDRRDWDDLKRGAAGADHVHLQPHRRHRRLAVQRAGGGAADREHRGRGQPRRARRQPGRALRDRRSPGAARRRSGSRSTAAACASWSTATQRPPTGSRIHASSDPTGASRGYQNMRRFL